MKQIIYRSQPFGFDDSTLANILLTARRNNARNAITGALICRHDVYLQLIEGPADAIDALYAKIQVDNRHGDVRLLSSSDVDERMFPDWAMLDDEWPSLFWPEDEVAAGAIEAATLAELRAAFARLA